MKKLLLLTVLGVMAFLCSGCCLFGNDFPENFPAEFKNQKFLEKESKEIVPGVMYYHYHFENVLPPDSGPFYRLSKIFINANGWSAPVRGKKLSPEDTAKQDETAKARIQEAYEKLKKNESFKKVALEYSEDPAAKGKRPYFGVRGIIVPGEKTIEPELEAVLPQLKKSGDFSAPVRTPKGYYILRLDKLVTRMPVSIYYLIVDWDKADVRLKLAQCGILLKTVKQMVEKHDPVGAVNGAYFHFVPPKTFYPLKIDGKMYEATGYDSHDGLCWSGSDFPTLDKEANFGKYDNVIMGYYIWRDGKYTLNPKTLRWTGIAEGDTPLTSVGLDKKNRRLVLMTSDGRFPEQAPGLSFYSEGYFMSIAGCTDVLSIDGGGSCTMLIREDGKTSDPKNHPWDNKKFDHEGARCVQNCIYLIENKQAEK